MGRGVPGGGTVPWVAKRWWVVGRCHVSRNGGGRWDGAVGRETVVFGGTAVPWVAFVFFFRKILLYY